MGFSRDAWATLGWGMDTGEPLHRAAFRAQGKQALAAEVADATTAPTPLLPVLPEHEPDLPRALPEWAEELRGCDLPRCPVCALAEKEYLCEPLPAFTRSYLYDLLTPSTRKSD